MEEYLLSITIPTYNRAPFLDTSLEILHEQLKTVNDNVEIIVSNNCSTDNTSEIVQKHIDNGLSIIYVENEKNLGMDGNFTQCFRMARGKYVWLLGDDDYLVEGALSKILDALRGKDYGLFHIFPILYPCQGGELTTEYDDSAEYLKKVTQWITFISSNIVNAKYIERIDFEKYFGTLLIQIPLYLEAITSSDKNLYSNEILLIGGVDAHNNGGYHFFNILINKYLAIWDEFVKAGKISKRSYNIEKKSAFKILRKYIPGQLMNKKYTGNFKTESGWSILFKHYKFCPYFYLGILKLYIYKYTSHDMRMKIKRLFGKK